MSKLENKKPDSKQQDDKVKEKAGKNAAKQLLRIKYAKNCCPEKDNKDGIFSWIEDIFPCCSGDRNEECPDDDPDDKD